MNIKKVFGIFLLVAAVAVLPSCEDECTRHDGKCTVPLPCEDGSCFENTEQADYECEVSGEICCVPTSPEEEQEEDAGCGNPLLTTR